MSGRVRITALGLLLAPASLFAQQPVPPSSPIIIPASVGTPSPAAPIQIVPAQPMYPLPPNAFPRPGEPRTLPPNVFPGQPMGPGPLSLPNQFPPQVAPNDGGVTEIVPLPVPEKFRKVDSQNLSAERRNDSWQVWTAGKLLHDFGQSRADAKEALQTFHDLRPTEWAFIGTQRVVAEYGLTNGKPVLATVVPKVVYPVDLKSLRAEQVRGAWCLKDDDNILLNCGSSRIDAEQAVGVCRKYGFNRVGLIGFPNPTMTYLYAGVVTPEAPAPKRESDKTLTLARLAQEQSLTRTGISVPGVGFLGERVVIDPRRVDVRKERGEFVLAHGTDVIAKFGYSEWAARDALKVVRDCRFTEFCTVGGGGGTGLTFFLVDGHAPTRVPFSVQGIRFDPASLKVRAVEGHWGVYETGGHMLFAAATQDEGDQLVRLVQAYQFNQLCQAGTSPRASMKFLAKNGGTR
ncbi:hypothetical protein [Fimbriiglobus ruber]|uniref:Uncharacterized protein n=1 Tax=Fimbriiglobus ruber TaxID=1908690 RepID=A0A225E2D3_9BACT|nr:hypothetical protein [Fimbriiglobus ruber]OWK43649.1 hypothetical protein FRUB_03248 [Fimbriiglobus ruber]